MKPESIVFISGIPEPQAYGANVRTKDAANNAKKNDHNM
jgi:hypothetical protein